MKLFCRKYGDGKPLIFLHGLFGMSDLWIPIAKKIATKDYAVYLPDLRNHGRSPHSSDMHYHALSDDILELINDNDLEMPVIAGHSLGGRVAMHFATKYPEKVFALIVLDSSLKNYLEEARSMLGMFCKTLPKEKRSIHSNTSFANGNSDINLQQLIIKSSIRETNGQLKFRHNIDAIEENLPELMSILKLERDYFGKCLVIRAEKSGYIEADEVVDLKKVFKNMELHTIPDAGHWLKENNNALLRVLTSFLQSL